MSNASSEILLKMPLVTSGATNATKEAAIPRLVGALLAAACLVFGAQTAQAAPYLYVSNYSGDSVSVFDTADLSTKATITVGTAPVGVAINPAGTFVYVANATSTSGTSGTVSVINTSTNTVTATVTVGLDPQLLAVSPDGKSVYVANSQGSTVSVIDTATNTQTAKFDVGGYVYGLAFNPAGTKVYATLGTTSKVAVIDTSTNTVATTIPLTGGYSSNPLGVVVNPAGTYAYVASYGLASASPAVKGTVSVIDTSTNTVVDVITAGYGPIGIAISPDGNFVYVSNYSGYTVSIISTATNTVLDELTVGLGPRGISIDSTGTYAYVNNALGDTVSIIDLGTNTVRTSTLTTGSEPNYSAISSSSGLSVNPDQHGLTGMWYNPSTSGQGLVIETYPDSVSSGEGSLFAGWFTYDTTLAGGQRWYTLQGTVSSSSTTAALSIYKSTGGNFDAAPGVGSTEVGTASLQFIDCGHGVLRYDFTDGSAVNGFIPVERITPSTTCTATGDSGNANDYLLSGSWYDPEISGQGLIFDINPAESLLTAGWFTYAPDGQSIGGGASQKWYTLQTANFADGATSLSGIPIYESTGGVFNTAPTTDDPVSTVAVGTATVSFQSCSAMTLTYSFTSGTNTGLSGTISLARIGPTPTGCTL